MLIRTKCMKYKTNYRKDRKEIKKYNQMYLRCFLVPLLLMVGLLLFPKLFFIKDYGSQSNGDTAFISGKREDDIDRLTFIGVGDNLIHKEVYTDALQDDGSYDFRPMYSEVADIIAEKDLAFINQETIIGGDELGLSSYPAFNTPEDMAYNIKDIGFDLVGISNNHTLDKGKKGVENTIDIWEKVGVPIDGAFKSEEKSRDFPVIEKNGIKIALLAYTYGTNGIQPDTKWRVRYLEEENIRRDVEKAKLISDFVMVAAHWGDENYYGITEYQKRYAKLFNELGVAVVLGSHPHVLGPVEELENDRGEKTVVIYSTGNFISAQKSGTDNMLGQMATFDFVKTETQKRIENIKMIPIVTYFERNKGGMESNFKVIELEDYSEEMSNKHFFRFRKNKKLEPEYFRNKFVETIEEEYR